MRDPRSLAEAIYDESLGDDASSLLCELLDLHAIRTGQNTLCHAGRIFSGASWSRRRCPGRPGERTGTAEAE
jgi:hypothetical protein